MRLLSATVRNYRVHRAASVSLDAPLVMIHGPNESGKSTLAEAIHCALFLKAKGSTSLHEAMVSASADGLPEVELRFEARGQRHTLRKTFGSTARALTRLETEGHATLNGAQAEEALAALLGVEGALSGGGIENKMLQRWGHLWVWQGKSSESPFATLSESQEKLRDKLQPQGGASILSSPLDNAVIDRLQSWRDANFTSKGAKAGSPLDHAGKALAAATEREKTARAKLGELRQAAESHQQAVADRERHQRSLAEARARLKEVHEKLKQVDGLKARLAEKTRLRGNAAQTLADRVESDRQIREMETRLHQAREAAAPAEAGRKAAEEALKHARADLDGASRQREESSRTLQNLRRRADAWQAHLGALRESGRLRELDNALAKIRALQKEHEALRAKLAPLDAFDAKTLAKIRRADTKANEARARLEAYALEIELLADGETVSLDGESLAPGRPRTLTRSAELTVGGRTRIRLTPGGAEDLEKARKDAEKAVAARDDLFRGLAVASLEAAEKKRREREAIETEIHKVEARLDETDPGSVDAGRKNAAEALARFQARRDDLAAEEAFAGFPDDPAAAESAAESAQEALKAAETENRRAETAESAARKRAFEAERAFTAAKDTHEAQTKAIADLEGRLGFALDKSGNTEARSAAVNAARAALDQASAAEKSAGDELEALGAAQLELDKQRLDQAIGTDDRNFREAESIIIETRSILKSNGTADPEREAAEAEAEAARAEQRHRTLLRQAEVRRHLLERLHAARKEATDALTKPLEDAVAPYLGNLFAGSRPRIRWSADSASLEGFELDRTGRDQGLFPFARLSHGTRGQAALALRLALAQILAADHDGCLPLVLDDAFTHADLDRIEKIKTLLFQATQNNLQILLLTCHPGNYNGLGAMEVRLDPASAAS